MNSVRISTLRLGPGINALGRSPFSQGVTLFFMALIALVLLPLLVLMVLFSIVAFGTLRTRAWLLRQRQPNGALDGRRNVRVRLPDQADGPSAGS